MSQIIKFEKITSDGKALGYWHDKAIFVIGPVPGESAEVTITREKRTWGEGALRKIVEPSDKRREAREDHYLACSPWQGIDYPYQLALKRHMLAEIFEQPHLNLKTKDFYAAKTIFGYRNKLEFSVNNFDGQFGLAFHERGRFDSFLAAPDGCALGSDAMNIAAQAVAKLLVERKLDPHVQTITIRESANNGAIIAVVCVDSQADKLAWDSLIMPDGLQGLRVVTKLKHNVYKTLHLEGSTDLTEVVGGVTMSYPWDSFFQVNLEIFELVLKDIRAHVQKGANVLDLYGGAGSIGLALAKDGHKVSGVEIIQASVALANDNAEAVGLTNYHATRAPAEKLAPESFDGIDTVVVDPPRAGLHADVVLMLLDARPKRIIYVSCNPITQARDITLLQAAYEPSTVTGYDQYPGTLHLESLVVLDLKD